MKMETKIANKKSSRKTGQFSNIEDAIRFKNEELNQILKNVDLVKTSQK